MQFRVYGIFWAGGPEKYQSVEDILKNYNIEYEYISATERYASAYIIDIGPEKLFDLVEDQYIDIMISGGRCDGCNEIPGFIAFDGKRQLPLAQGQRLVPGLTGHFQKLPELLAD